MKSYLLLDSPLGTTRRVEWGWVADLRLWWTFVLLQKIFFYSIFSFNRTIFAHELWPLDWQFKHGCQLFTANNMFEVTICVAKPFFIGGCVNSAEKDVQRTVTNKPIYDDLKQLNVHFILDALTFVESSYLNQGGPAVLLCWVTFVETCPL